MDRVNSVGMVIFNVSIEFFETLFGDNLVPRRENISHRIHTRDQLHILICMFLNVGILLGYRRLKRGQIRLMIVACESFEAFIILLKGKT